MKYRQYSQHGFIRLRTALIVVGILVLIGLLITWLIPKNPLEQRAATNPQGYEAAAEQFIKAMSDKDGPASYAMFTNRYKKVIGSQSDWQKQLEISFRDTDGSPKFRESKPQPDPGGIYKGKDPQRVLYDFEFDSTPWETALLVLKDGNLWKIDEVKSDLK